MKDRAGPVIGIRWAVELILAEKTVDALSVVVL
jgi:hypothetical protein